MAKDTARLRYGSIAFAFALAAILAVVGAYSHRPLGDGLQTVPHRWAVEAPQAQAVDSIAAVRAGDGRVLLYTTDKAANRLDVFDAAAGTWLRSIQTDGAGRPSVAGAGRFGFPNGIVAVTLPRGKSEHADSRGPAAAAAAARDDGEAASRERRARSRQVVLVAERDGSRVKAFSADGAPLGTLGEQVLRSPLGLAASRHGASVLLYVTDTAGIAEARVHVFELSLTADGDGNESVLGRHVRSFGADGEGDLDDPESITVDDAFDRVLVCDERRRRPEVKVYRRDGRFIGTLGRGLIDGEPEGLALIGGPNGEAGRSGWIIVTDQRPHVTVWHAFDRHDLRHVASFSGHPTIANTDGISVYQAPFGSFERGALFAVHDDHEVRAYDLGDVMELLQGGKQR